ncbi:hypothetical protein BSKO_10971 [Bryopsis sp. KO-2023]|nr:hypothetical protein BSKO_10971 [Bryopsis sp. KO-2023]
MEEKVNSESTWAVPTISYDQLAAPRDAWDDVDAFLDGIRESGILAVSGVPGFAELRKKLMLTLNDFGNLPEETVRSKYSLEASKYSVGWSLGVEIFEGQRDYSKGSFYANPFNDNPRPGATHFPEYHTPNVWPEELPELEKNFKEMGKIMMHVALMVAQGIDRSMEKEMPESSGVVSEILKSSQIHKARGLIYFPTGLSNWCGLHKDHGLLTGLAPGLFVSGDREVDSPDPKCGLYIASPDGSTHRAVMDKTSIAFQIGEALQAISRGKFKATPHWVAAPETDLKEIRRLSFALFFQPSVDYEIVGGVDAAEVGWEDGMTFGDFAKRKFDLYYQKSVGKKE